MQKHQNTRKYEGQNVKTKKLKATQSIDSIDRHQPCCLQTNLDDLRPMTRNPQPTTHLQDTGNFSKAEALVEVGPPAALEEVTDMERPLRVEVGPFPLIHDAGVKVRPLQPWRRKKLKIKTLKYKTNIFFKEKK